MPLQIGSPAIGQVANTDFYQRSYVGIWLTGAASDANDAVGQSEMSLPAEYLFK